MKKISLNGKWHIASNGSFDESISLDGNVPGSVLGDIVTQISEYKDVFYRDNAEKVQKFENYNWIYSKGFCVSEIYSGARLVFERLDTYCDIYLNGKHVAYCDNGNIKHIFDIDGKLCKGSNKLDIYFYSPINAVSGRKLHEAAFTAERIHTRRMQCSYGWDWTMRFVTCGIPADAYIVFKDEAVIIESAYIYTKSIDSYSAQIGIDTFFEKNSGGILCFDIYDNENVCVKHIEKYSEEDTLRLVFDIENPKLWYPHGYGEQPLYSLEISTEGKLLHRESFGIRTVKILQTEDREGSENYDKCKALKTTPFAEEYDGNSVFSGFTLVVNGIKIMCKGGNFVPCQPFYLEDPKKKITATLERAVECGMNMLRVWGGGQFECEHFYDECTRLGITVCQDFLMACGRYPEDNSEFLAQLTREAEYASKLLRNKACLVWWHGDNENAVNGCDTDTDYRGRKSALKAIAPVLYKNDPYREFLPSSPFGGKKYASNTVGTTHNSQYLSYFFDWLENEKLDDCKEYINNLNARFVMEDPTMGAASLPSLLKMMTEADIFGDDLSMWKYHTQSNPALRRHLFEYMDIFAEKVLGKFTDGKDRFFKYKYIQYEWVRLSLERARRNKWFCSGNMFWMVNDCWPAAGGWSIIDWYNMPKASYYAFRRTAQPLTVSVDKADGIYGVYASNDSLENAAVNFSVKALLENGEITDVFTGKYTVPGSETNMIYSFNEKELPQGAVSVIADVYNSDMKLCDRSFHKSGALGIHPCHDFEVEVNKNSYKVTAKKYIHAFEAEGNAVFDDNCFIMLPGETRTVSFKTTDKCTDITFTAYTL